MALHFAVSVRETICEINGVVGAFEVVSERHFIELFCTLAALLCIVESWALVSYADAVCMPVLCLRFYGDSHALVVKRTALREIKHTECCVAYVALVLDWKVEPLMVTSSVGIDSHIQWEFSRVGLDNHVQVAWFEVWVEEIRFLTLVYLSEERIRLDVWSETEERSL